MRFAFLKSAWDKMAEVPTEKEKCTGTILLGAIMVARARTGAALGPFLQSSSNNWSHLAHSRNMKNQPYFPQARESRCIGKIAITITIGLVDITHRFCTEPFFSLPGEDVESFCELRSSQQICNLRIGCGAARSRRCWHCHTLCRRGCEHRISRVARCTFYIGTKLLSCKVSMQNDRHVNTAQKALCQVQSF